MRQCKNCGAFLKWTPGKGLLGHFRVAEHIPRSDPSHRWAPLPAHGTKGVGAEREEEEVNYYIERGEYSGDEGGRTSGERTARGVQAMSAAPAACQPLEATSLRGGARTE